MYSPEARQNAVQRILDGLAIGTPMTVICRADGMPDPATVWRWTEEDEVLSQAIARARDAGWDQIALDALAIIDQEPEIAVSEGGSRRDAGFVQWQKLRFEGRLKLLAKWDPKRYGEMIKHGNADGSNIDLVSALQEARERAKQG